MARHGVVVRVTHWINAVGTFALIVSGIAILFAHPRLYWGETGAVGTPALIDLPIPFIFGHSGWGRYLHFLAAWVCVAAGVLYLLAGVVTRHFGQELLPSKADLSWTQLTRLIADHARLRLSTHASLETYNGLQRLTYALVVFVLGPVVLLSGLAFSPMLASAAPALVSLFGGQQSARTIHFFAAAAVVAFLMVHIVMVAATGFTARMRSMIVGDERARTGDS
jgi:thiosulfate reductase cytochrome b subunit